MLPTGTDSEEFRVAEKDCEAVCPIGRITICPSHPHRLKAPMRLVDHLYFVAEHDDHHLARNGAAAPVARTIWRDLS